jgi:TetR/AcrR family transcriptional regulator, cholesterol catabolism regulator
MTEINETRERIRVQASELFMKYGIRSISMDDIANSLGMSKKTIYQYFADKDELVDSVILQELSQSETSCELDRNQADNAIQEVFLAMDMALEMFHSMNPSIVFEIQKYHPSAFQRIQKHKNEYLVNLVRTNLVRGISEENFRPEINVEIMARFRVESMMLPLNPEFQAKTRASLVEIGEELILHYLFGLVTMKGYKLMLKYLQERTQKFTGNAKSK